MVQNSFILYHDMWEQLSELNDEELGKIMKAIFIYHAKGEIIEMDRITKLIFIPIKNTLDRDREKWDIYREKQQENGKKGGRPKMNPTVIPEYPNNPTVIPEYPNNPTVIPEYPNEAKKADSVSVNASVNVSVSEIYDFWNLQKIIQHTVFTEDIRKQIEKQLKSYTMEQIKKSIKNYGDTYNDASCYFKHKWTLAEFLKRSNALPVFFDKGPDDYRSKEIKAEKKKEAYDQPNADEEWEWEKPKKE